MGIRFPRSCSSASKSTLISDISASSSLAVSSTIGVGELHHHHSAMAQVGELHHHFVLAVAQVLTAYCSHYSQSQQHLVWMWRLHMLTSFFFILLGCWLAYLKGRGGALITGLSAPLATCLPPAGRWGAGAWCRLQGRSALAAPDGPPLDGPAASPALGLGHCRAGREPEGRRRTAVGGRWGADGLGRDLGDAEIGMGERFLSLASLLGFLLN